MFVADADGGDDTENSAKGQEGDHDDGTANKVAGKSNVAAKSRAVVWSRNAAKSKAAAKNKFTGPQQDFR